MTKRQAPQRDIAPVAARYRLRYRKTGRMRFASARDFQRALERAIRRGGVPVAFTAGFSPHPRISYANTVATGVSSHAEYFEVALTRPVNPEALRRIIDEGLPEGFDVLEAVPAIAPDFGDRLQASLWELTLDDVGAHHARLAADTFAGLAVANVNRVTKSGPTTVDARAAVCTISVQSGSLTVAAGDPCAILLVVVRHVTPSVRPQDVLSALCSGAGLPPSQAPRICRLAQGPLGTDGQSIGDPLEPDRVSASQL